VRLKWAAFVGLGVLVAAPVWSAEEGFPRPFEVTHTERFDFGPGGTVHLVDSYGYLSIDGWDKPQVEVTITKSTNKFYDPRDEEQAKKRLELIRVNTERKSDSELSVTTIPLSRHGTWAPPLPRTTEAGVTVELQVHVPYDSHLTIRQDNGYVWVSDVTGEIEASSHTGDMIVMLPDPGPYAIDARTRMGSVNSDFYGRGIKRFLLGTRFKRPNENAVRHIHLRMGRGSITIKQSPPVLTSRAN
jgi:hypothetical protein